MSPKPTAQGSHERLVLLLASEEADKLCSVRLAPTDRRPQAARPSGYEPPGGGSLREPPPRPGGEEGRGRPNPGAARLPCYSSEMPLRVTFSQLPSALNS